MSIYCSSKHVKNILWLFIVLETIEQILFVIYLSIYLFIFLAIYLSISTYISIYLSRISHSKYEVISSRVMKAGSTFELEDQERKPWTKLNNFLQFFSSYFLYLFLQPRLLEDTLKNKFFSGRTTKIRPLKTTDFLCVFSQ